MSRRSAIAAFVLLPSALGLTACSESSGRVTASEACKQTAVSVLAAEANLYDTHPLWNTEIPGVDANPDELAAYDLLQADEEAQWNAIYAPLYAACESPSDWWATAQKYPGIAGATDTEYLEPESLRTWCTGIEMQPACAGIDEWLITNPE